jgi:16S rRNA (cytidine1402-2'-O)-methyltransferase
MPGTLFVVATPIGNLEDLSMRALRVLRGVQLVAAEDTRRTAKLLSHYQIRSPMVSLREHNEHRETPRLLARLAAGDSIALVSDAGTPTISDPGRDLVNAARRQGYPVVPIPGPSAVTTALAASGFPAERFLFLGFPPRTGTARTEWLETMSAEPGPVVCFEAPTRIEATLRDMMAMVVKRPILVCRELTKRHEELVEYSNLTPVQPVGEFTLVVGPRDPATIADSFKLDPALIAQMVHALVEATHVSRQDAEAMAAKALGLKPFQIKNIIKKHGISVKRQKSSGEAGDPS